MLVHNYSYVLCNSPEEHSSQDFSHKNNVKNVSKIKTKNNNCILCSKA
jgi:hypothetical protein